MVVTFPVTGTAALVVLGTSLITYQIATGGIERVQAATVQAVSRVANGKPTIGDFKAAGTILSTVVAGGAAAKLAKTAVAGGGVALSAEEGSFLRELGKDVIIKPGKWDYFFGRVNYNQHNLARSLQNLSDLKALGFDEAVGGKNALIVLFERGVAQPATSSLVTQYGLTVVRTIPVGDIGAIDVAHFYPGGDLSGAAEVSSIIPKIFK